MKRSFLLFALVVSGCSKVDIYQPQTQAAPPVMSQENQATRARIVEIDRLLSTPLTGRQDDADQRAALRAEREALVGNTGNYQGPNVVVNNSLNVHPNQQYSRQQRQQNQVPMVTVVGDSGADNSRFNGVEGMVPSERERYFRELRLRNPNPVVGVPVERDRRWH